MKYIKCAYKVLFSMLILSCTQTSASLSKPIVSSGMAITSTSTPLAATPTTTSATPPATTTSATPPATTTTATPPATPPTPVATATPAPTPTPTPESAATPATPAPAVATPPAPTPTPEATTPATPVTPPAPATTATATPDTTTPSVKTSKIAPHQLISTVYIQNNFTQDAKLNQITFSTDKNAASVVKSNLNVPIPASKNIYSKGAMTAFDLTSNSDSIQNFSGIQNITINNTLLTITDPSTGLSVSTPIKITQTGGNWVVAS